LIKRTKSAFLKIETKLVRSFERLIPILTKNKETKKNI